MFSSDHSCATLPLNSSSSSPTSIQRRSFYNTADSDAFLLRSSASPARSTSHFKPPATISKPNSKWKSVLARLYLGSRPARPARDVSTSTASSDRNVQPRCSIPPVSSTSPALDLSSGFDLHGDHTSMSVEPSVGCCDVPPSNILQTCTDQAFAAIADGLLTTTDSFPFSLDVASDVERLLCILSETPLQKDASKRTHALAALCALCVSSQSSTKRCVAAGGVEILIDLLSSTAQPSIPAAAIVEESTEKALLLLQLLTSSTSEDGCTVALRHSSSIIAALGKKLLRGSESCTSSSIAILTALARRSDATLFRKAVAETAIPSKLVVVLQVAPKESTKRRAGRLLRLLAEPPQQQNTID